MKNSLVSKLNSIKSNESIVIICENISYQQLMRQIGGCKSRGTCSEKIKYKKASVIVGDDFYIGVKIYLEN